MRSAVVTGSSSGIGKAIAARLLDDGWRVAGLDLAPAGIEHERLTSTRVDLGGWTVRRPIIESIETTDALVHAAGIMRGAKLGALDHTAGDLLWRIHVDAAMALADWLAPRMPVGGRIVLIGSRAAKGVVGKSQYGAAKAALVALGRSWAKELITKGITVNVVAPAATETAMLSDRNAPSSRLRRRRSAATSSPRRSRRWLLSCSRPMLTQSQVRRLPFAAGLRSDRSEMRTI